GGSGWAEMVSGYFTGCDPAGEGRERADRDAGGEWRLFPELQDRLSRRREIPASGIDFGKDGCADGNYEDEGRAGGGACEIIFKGIQVDRTPARIGAHDRPLEFDGFDGEFDRGRKHFQAAGGLGAEFG